VNVFQCTSGQYIFFGKKAVIRLPFCLRLRLAKSFPTTFFPKKIYCPLVKCKKDSLILSNSL